jgi:hypothetical protein
MRAADCKPYRSFYELLTGKELPWPKAASVGGLFVFEDDSYWHETDLPGRSDDVR